VEICTSKQLRSKCCDEKGKNGEYNQLEGPNLEVSFKPFPGPIQYPIRYVSDL